MGEVWCQEASAMGEVVYARQAAQKIEDIRAYYDNFDQTTAERAVQKIVTLLNLLSDHPLIGRPVSGAEHLRERVIPFGGTGFVALYRIEPRLDRILILAIRHQREDGYDEADSH